MQKAVVQIKRMTGMINGFLNISRLESGKIYIEKKSFDFDLLITEIVKESELTIASHVINYQSCRPVTIFADRDKIASVLTNFISNAVKIFTKIKIY